MDYEERTNYFPGPTRHERQIGSLLAPAFPLKSCESVIIIVNFHNVKTGFRPHKLRVDTITFY